MMEHDHYYTLGVSFNASPDEIQEAYNSLIRLFRPDESQPSEPGDQLLAIQTAYDVLSNPQKRIAYNATLPAQIRIIPAVTVSAIYSKQILPCLSEPQLTYILLDLVCTGDVDQKDELASHVCLVLDRSTSMAGDRLDMVKASAINLLQQLRGQDTLSVVSFSDRADVLIPPTRASSLSKSDHRISLMHAGGGTEILQGLTLGMEQLHQSSSALLRHLILLTDGFTYGDDEGCLEIARQASEEGISISILGIGHEWNDILMDRIASLSGGESILVADARDLDNFLMKKVSEMESVYARGLRIEFESSPGVELRYAFRLLPGISDLPVSDSILLGDLLNRKSISILLEFFVPPTQVEMDRLTLAKGQIRMEIPALKMAKSRILFDLQRPVKTSIDTESTPPVIIEAMAKLTLYRMQEKIRLEVEEGEIEKATRHLHYLATHLLAQGDRELAHSVLIEAEHVQQSRRLSDEGGKKIKYGTRSLLQNPSSELTP